MNSEQPTVTLIEEKKRQGLPTKHCPFGYANETDVYCTTKCGWYVTDSGLSECAIVKLAKGWCL